MKAIDFRVFIRPAITKGGMPLIEIPPWVADHFLTEKNKKRMVITFDNGTSFHRALQRNKDGFSFMVLGKSTLRDAQKEAGQEVSITLEEDNSEYGMPMPEELAEVMRQDPEGKDRFDSLSAGLKRSLLYYLGSAKSVDTRIKRSFDIMQKLKSGEIPRN